MQIHFFIYFFNNIPKELSGINFSENENEKSQNFVVMSDQDFLNSFFSFTN